jgi:signal transduction histidine kinase/Tfp pilus assembly protein PilF
MNYCKKIFFLLPIFSALLLLFYNVHKTSANTTFDSLEEKLEHLSEKKQIEPLLQLSDLYYDIDFNKSLDYAFRAFKISEEYGIKERIAESLKSIALAYHLKKDIDSAFYYYNKAVLYEIEFEDHEKIADSYNNIGLIYMAWQYPKPAIEFLNKALESSLLTDNINITAMIHNNLGVVYKRTEQFDKSLEHLTKALSIYTENKDIKGIAACNNNIGTILVRIKNNTKAIERFKTALENYRSINDLDGVSKSYNNLGNAYENIGDIEKAESYYLKSLNIKRELGSMDGISVSYNNLGLLHKSKNNFANALDYLQKSLKIKEEISDAKGITSTLNNLASVYIEMDQPKKAMEYLDSCISISQENNYRENLRQAYRSYSEAYEVKGDYKNTLYYKELYYKLRDSELVENTEKLSDILVNFQIDRKNKEIEILQKDYTIQKLELENKDIVFYTLLIVIAVILITGSLISYLFYKRYKEKKKHEEELISKNIELNKLLQELRSEIEKRKLAEEGLIKAKEDITLSYQKEKELNELKSRFVSMISHEYRNPLTVILSAAEILSIIRDGKQFDDNVNKIKSQVKVMVDLLEDVLMVGRIETNRLNLNIQSIELTKFCRNLADEVSTAYRNSHEIKIKTEMNTDNLETDPKLLRYILTNLLSNAVKYSPNGKIVLVTLQKDDSELTIKVTDYGIGILPQDQKYIFDPFFRGKNVENIQGTGYGLAILKGCVETLKGSIHLDSTPGRGSTFSVKIPM